MKMGWRTISVIGRAGPADQGRLVRRRRHAETGEPRGGEQAEHRHAQIRAQIRRLEELHRRAREHRADERRGQAAREHERDGTAAELGERRLGRREPVLLGERHGDSEKQRGRDEEPELTPGHRRHADQTTGHRAQGAHDESDTAAHALHEQRGGNGAERGADHRHRRGQRRQRFVAGQRVAGEAAHGGDERHRGRGRRLGQGEKKDVPETKVYWH